HGVMAARRAADVGQREGARRPPDAGAPLELTFALECAQVIERSPRRDPESLSELAHRRRHTVLGLEAPHEVQHLTLPARQLTHPLPSVTGDITQLVLTSQQKASAPAGRLRGVQEARATPAPRARRRDTS